MCTMSKSKVIQNNDFFQEKLSETKICDKSYLNNLKKDILGQRTVIINIVEIGQKGT